MNELEQNRRAKAEAYLSQVGIAGFQIVESNRWIYSPKAGNIRKSVFVRPANRPNDKVLKKFLFIAFKPHSDSILYVTVDCHHVEGSGDWTPTEAVSVLPAAFDPKINPNASKAIQAANAAADELSNIVSAKASQATEFFDNIAADANGRTFKDGLANALRKGIDQADAEEFAELWNELCNSHNQASQKLVGSFAA